MRVYMRAFLLSSILAVPAAAQWLNFPDAGTPRTADGKPNLSAPSPKTPDGKPELSGIWLADDITHFFDLAADRQQPEVPFQPWAKALSQKRQDNLHKEDPPGALHAARCAADQHHCPIQDHPNPTVGHRSLRDDFHFRLPSDLHRWAPTSE